LIFRAHGNLGISFTEVLGVDETKLSLDAEYLYLDIAASDDDFIRR